MNSPTLAHKIPFSMCRLIYIPVPDYEARLAILNIKLANKVAKNVNIPLLARYTEWEGNYTRAVCRRASTFRVEIIVRELCGVFELPFLSLLFRGFMWMNLMFITFATSTDSKFNPYNAATTTTTNLSILNNSAFFSHMFQF